jgi:hypothetical protein
VDKTCPLTDKRKEFEKNGVSMREVVDSHEREAAFASLALRLHTYGVDGAGPLPDRLVGFSGYCSVHNV